MEDEEIEERIEEVSYSHIQSRYKDKFKKVYNRVHDKEVAKALQLAGSWDYFLENLQGYLENHKPLEIDFKREVINNNDSKSYVLSDIHLGKVGSDDVLKRLQVVLNSILDTPEKNIHIISL